jgi:hypothetical protein
MTAWDKAERDSYFNGGTEHEHVFGPFEVSQFGGDCCRRCQVDGCKFISLDPDEDEDEDDTIISPTQPDEE